MPPARPLSEAELRRRRPVWIALSELWLDTELTGADLRQLARVVAASGYSDEEIGHIHWNEVAPVVWGNLLSVAGVWSGFDEDWLCERAARLAGRSPARFDPTRRWARRLVNREWRRLLDLLPLARGGEEAGHAPARGLLHSSHMAHATDGHLYAQWVELLAWLQAEATARGLGFQKVADFPDYIYRMERPYDLPTTVMSVALTTGGQPLLVAAVSPRHVDLKGVSLRLMGGSKHWHLHAGERGLLEGKRPFTRERLGVLLDGAVRGVA